MSKLSITIDGHTFTVEVQADFSTPAGYQVEVDGSAIPVLAPPSGVAGTMEWIMIGNRPYEIVLDPDLHWIKSRSGRHSLTVRSLDAAATSRPLSGDGRVKAPIPGLIAKVLVEMGQEVTAGQTLVVLEAMKMENEIRATASGRVRALNVRLGQSVGMGDVLVEISH